MDNKQFYNHHKVSGRINTVLQDKKFDLYHVITNDLDPKSIQIDLIEAAIDANEI